MEERNKPPSERINDWMNELLPDGAADIGMWQQPECTSVKAERPNPCQLSVDSHAYPRNLSQLHQIMQTSAGCNSASLMAKREQDPLNVMQHSYQITPQRILEPKGGVVLERAHPRLQMPALHQSQNLTMSDQLKPGSQPQAMPFGALQASSESSSQVDLTNSIDWVNPTYQKILQMKEVYLPQLISLHHRMQELKRQSTDAEMANKWDKNKFFIEKTIRLLKISKPELIHLKMERVCQMLNDAMKFMSQIRQRNIYQKQNHQVDASGNHIEAPHTQPRENHLQMSSAPASLLQPSRPGGALDLPQSTLNSFSVGSSAGVHKVDASSAANSYQCNMMRPTHQWVPQGNVAPSPLKGAQLGFDQRALRMLLHPSGGVSQYNNLGTLQQTVAPSRNIFNSLDYSINPLAQTPVSMPSLQNNQQEAMKRQKMKQPAQQLMADKNKPQMLQKRTEDTKLRRLVGNTQKWSPVLPPSPSPYAISPQNSQQSSSQLELKDLSSKFLKSETPSLSSASQSALPSPLTPTALITPLTPSSIPADSIKSPLLQESSKFEKNPATASQPPLQNTTHNQLATDTQRSNKPCLHKESTSFGDKKSSHAVGDPLKHLIEVVKSISSKSLNATLRDINAVTSLTDRAAEDILHSKPRKVIFHDLADDMIRNCSEGTLALESSTSMKPRMKHELVTVALDDLTTDSEFGASGSIKRLKTEPNNLLLEEIKEINQKLIEMVVDVMTWEDVSRQGSGKGTLIRCSYIPVGLSGNNMKIQNTSKLMIPNMLLELIVSSDYPNSSPTVLEKVPSGFCDADEGKHLWMKAKSNFIRSLRQYSIPISVKDMAEAWGVSAREVFHELAEEMGGGSFSSNYGKWENCAVSV